MFRIQNVRLSKEEYIEFLKRTDLGSQYPMERFEERIETLVSKTNISIAAIEEDKIVGVLFALSDFAYWMFITDLGVDREYVHRGIGKALVKYAHELAGGIKNIAVYTVANSNAITFYESLGMKKSTEVMELNHIEWTEFRVI